MLLSEFFNCPIPFSINLLYTFFVCVLVPLYWRQYGPANFLWFSDLALFIGLAALWLESSLLASMQAVSVLLLELLWNIEFFAGLMTGKQIFGLAEYMFKSDKPLWLRGLSLFHVPLPVILLWQVYCFGYDARAWIAQTILFWLVMPLCFFFTRPGENINWVFGPGNQPQRTIPAVVYLALLLIGAPLFIYLPTHILLSALVPAAGPQLSSY
jgi:hypothetical protein